MSKGVCALEYLAKQINAGIEEGKIEDEISPIQAKCYCCTEEIRCQFYMPLKRVQHIREGDILYRRNYRK